MRFVLLRYCAHKSRLYSNSLGTNRRALNNSRLWPICDGNHGCVNTRSSDRVPGKPKQPYKARLIGIEDAVDAGTVEKHLWGYNHSNLVGTTPLFYRNADGSQESRPLQLPSKKDDSTFTLIDTHLMTVTHCRSSLPPTAMLICGQEAGMQRTLLCSYDWRTQTFHRQAILRVMRQGLGQMHRVERIRFSLAAHPNMNPDGRQSDGWPAGPEQQQPAAITTALSPVSKRNWRTWKRELLFLAICLVRIHANGLGLVLC